LRRDQFHAAIDHRQQALVRVRDVALQRGEEQALDRGERLTGAWVDAAGRQCSELADLLRQRVVDAVVDTLTLEEVGGRTGQAHAEGSNDQHRGDHACAD
jgi:hypothetical protein